MASDDKVNSSIDRPDEPKKKKRKAAVTQSTENRVLVMSAQPYKKAYQSNKNCLREAKWEFDNFLSDVNTELNKTKETILKEARIQKKKNYKTLNVARKTLKKDVVVKKYGVHLDRNILDSLRNACKLDVYETLKVCSLNVAGLARRLENGKFLQFINEHDILCFTEIKAWEEDIKQVEGKHFIRVNGYEPFNKYRPKDSCQNRSGGIGIYIHKRLQSFVQKSDGECEYVNWIKIEGMFPTSMDSVILGVIYIPSSDPSTERENFWNERMYKLFKDEVNQKCTESRNVILTGDFNCYTGTLSDITMDESSLDVLRLFRGLGIPLARSSRDKHKPRVKGQDLIKLCKENKLFILNGRLHSDKGIGEITCTCTRQQTTESQSDNPNTLESGKPDTSKSDKPSMSKSSKQEMLKSGMSGKSEYDKNKRSKSDKLKTLDSGKKPNMSEADKPRTSESSKSKNSEAGKPKTSESSKPKMSESGKPHTSKSCRTDKLKSGREGTSISKKPERSTSGKPYTSKTSNSGTSQSSKPEISASEKQETSRPGKLESSESGIQKMVKSGVSDRSELAMTETSKSGKRRTPESGNPKTSKSDKPDSAESGKTQTSKSGKLKKKTKSVIDYVIASDTCLDLFKSFKVKNVDFGKDRFGKDRFSDVHSALIFELKFNNFAK